MVSRSDINRYADAAEQAVKAAERELRIYMEAADLTVPGAIGDLAEFVASLVQRYGTVVSVAASEWYEELRAAAGITSNFVAVVDDSVNRAQVQASTRYLATAGGDVAARIGGMLHMHVLSAGRQTVNANLDADPEPVRYARVPRGAITCAFCSMLASRGWVYRSKESATQRKRGGRYHASCDCVIVPSWARSDPKISGYDPDQLYDHYQQAQRAVGGNDESAILAEMRRQHPERYTDGLRPKRGRITVPDNLTVSSHEMDTAERLARHGLNIKFRAISHEQNAKNPDIEIDGEIWEMKSPKGSSEKNTISEQFKRAKRQAPRMVIDLTRCGLPDDLAIAQIKRRFAGQRQIAEIIIIDHREELTRLP